jgi:tellurite resistance protein TehA-like permease
MTENKKSDLVRVIGAITLTLITLAAVRVTAFDIKHGQFNPDQATLTAAAFLITIFHYMIVVGATIMDKLEEMGKEAKKGSVPADS